MFRDIGHALYRRAVENGRPPVQTIDVPSWSYAIFFVNFLILLPIVVIVSITKINVCPLIPVHH